MSVESIYDPKHDVLYVKRVGTKINASREHPQHAWLVCNYDFDRQVVGVQLLNPTVPAKTRWRDCSARHGLPTDIRVEIDRFMDWLEAGSKDPERCAARRAPTAALLDACAS